MNASHLRVYHGPQSDSIGIADTPTDSSYQQNVTVPLMDVLPLLADAVGSQRTWLKDFDNDEISIAMKYVNIHAIKIKAVLLENVGIRSIEGHRIGR